MNQQPRAKSQKPTTQNPELRTQNQEPRTKNPEPRTQNSELRTQNSELRTQNPELRTQNQEPRTQNPEPRTQNPEPRTNIMSGIYIHIPFCRQACHYCNFHFSVSLKQEDAFVAALLREIELQSSFFGDNADAQVPVDTVYFGGGTPSVLDTKQLDRIFRTLSDHFVIADGAEITLEANPDDLNSEKLHMLRQTPVNRLSIGIQSFYEADLRYMNRIHSPVQAIGALENARAAGFSNINIDLIYATPTLNDRQWADSLARVVALEIPHISSYALTVEKQTALEVMIRKGKVMPVDEEQAARQFEMMAGILERAGYHHYEISNFALPGYFSKHNLAYWQGVPYIGLGPSAHSFINDQRSWNVANTSSYISLINSNTLPQSIETISPIQKLNEYLMISLRTMWGCDLEYVSSLWGGQSAGKILEQAGKYLSMDLLEKHDQMLLLTDKGKLFADGIAADLFME